MLKLASVTRIQLLAALGTALITLLVFSGTYSNQFVSLDDYAYIVNNSHIKTLNMQTVTWAFTSFHEGNWHPVTMLSLALDRHFWGLDPYGYHLTNIIIHCATVFTVCILFVLLFNLVSSRQATPATLEKDVAFWSPIISGSIAGALFFGIHPLRVESVVWASERKDVLCLFFITQALYWYIRFTLQRDCDSERSTWRFGTYWGVLLLSTLAVMSKPAAVSLPLVLLILDWYPLERLRDRSRFSRVTAEKVPVMLLALMCGVLTLFSQTIAMNLAPEVDLPSRLLVACKALLFYLYTAIWPSGLAVFYIHPGNVAASDPLPYILSAVLVVLISLAVIWLGRRNKFWPAIWLYYCITIAPMLGLIQVGGQWVADRYSYLPSLGLALLWGGAVVWMLDRQSCVRGKTWLAAGYILGICPLLIYAAVTIRQIPYWRNTETLASRVISCMPHQSGAVYFARAIYRNEHGDYEGALADIGETMSIALRRGLREPLPRIAFEHALILKNLGRFTEALNLVEWGITISPGTVPADATELRNELVFLNAGTKASSSERPGSLH